MKKTVADPKKETAVDRLELTDIKLNHYGKLTCIDGSSAFYHNKSGTGVCVEFHQKENTVTFEHKVYKQDSLDIQLGLKGTELTFSKDNPIPPEIKKLIKRALNDIKVESFNHNLKISERENPRSK